MSNSDETTIDLNDAETYIDAATQHGEDDDPDHEVGDLQTYFRVAFGLLTPEQKVEFSKNAQVREYLALGLNLDSEDDLPG